MEAVQFDLRVGETSMLPGSRNELRMQVDSLAQQGLIGGVDQLKVVGWPNPESTYAKSPRGLQDAQMAEQMENPEPPVPEMGQEEMLPPEAMPPDMMGAMPPDMMGMPPPEMGGAAPPDDLMAMIEQEAAAAGIPPEVVFQLLAEQGAI
jgi:hypothetical protein